jgi:hypothetical protein
MYNIYIAKQVAIRKKADLIYAGYAASNDVETPN